MGWNHQLDIDYIPLKNGKSKPLVWSRLDYNLWETAEQTGRSTQIPFLLNCVLALKKNETEKQW